MKDQSTISKVSFLVSRKKLSRAAPVRHPNPVIDAASSRARYRPAPIRDRTNRARAARCTGWAKPLAAMTKLHAGESLTRAASFLSRSPCGGESKCNCDKWSPGASTSRVIIFTSLNAFSGSAAAELAKPFEHARTFFTRQLKPSLAPRVNKLAAPSFILFLSRPAAELGAAIR